MHTLKLHKVNNTADDKGLSLVRVIIIYLTCAKCKPT